MASALEKAWTRGPFFIALFRVVQWIHIRLEFFLFRLTHHYGPTWLSSLGVCFMCIHWATLPRTDYKGDNYVRVKVKSTLVSESSI